MGVAEIGVESANWIQLAEGRDQGRVFVNAALNFRFHKPYSYIVT